MIKVLLADDHTLLTESLCIVLQRDEDIKVVATAHNGSEALEKCKVLMPDVVLMDIKMPQLSGIEAVRLIKESCQDTKVAILTSLEEGKSILSSFVNGADAYLIKDTPPEELKLLIKCIHSGFCVLSSSAKHLFFNEFLKCGSMVSVDESVKSLKNEDIQIIRYISEGKNNGEIGEILGYAQGTVKNKITRLLEITGAGSRAQLVMFALRNNLL